MSEELMSLDSLEFGGDLTKLPTNKELPLGFVELEIKAVSTGKTKAADGSINERTGKPKVGEKVFVKMQVSVTDHPAQASYKGITDFHSFYIGSDTDPAAKNQATWKANATDLMKCLKKAKVAMSPTTKISDALKAAVGAKFVGEVKLEVSKDPRYGDKHRIRNFFAVGEKEPKVLDGEGGVAAYANGHASPAAGAGQAFSNDD